MSNGIPSHRGNSFGVEVLSSSLAIGASLVYSTVGRRWLVTSTGFPRALPSGRNTRVRPQTGTREKFSTLLWNYLSVYQRQLSVPPTFTTCGRACRRTEEFHPSDKADCRQPLNMSSPWTMPSWRRKRFQSGLSDMWRASDGTSASTITHGTRPKATTATYTNMFTTS